MSDHHLQLLAGALLLGSMYVWWWAIRNDIDRPRDR